MANTGKKITILGAGISGLATAYWLYEKGYKNITILEKNTVPGGAMTTVSKNGYLMDFGPNSGLETTPLIRRLAKAVGLDEEMIYANEEGNKRYILKHNKLLPLPTSPLAFFTSNLFSTKAKLRLMIEPFIGKSEDGYNQSISEFVTRRLGKEFLDYAIDPFVSGVFAGNPNKLSVKSAFPKLYRLEEEYGGLIKGMILGARERKKSKEESKQSAKMFSFINGMQTFPEAILKTLGNNKAEFNSVVQSIIKLDSGKYKIEYTQGTETKEIETDIILSTIPAHASIEPFSFLDNDIGEYFNNVSYPEVKVLYAAYDKSQITQPLDGFGFLIPSLEKKNFLGGIWSSVIFKNRAPEGKAVFTIFIGGAQKENVFNGNPEYTTETVIKEFQKIMQISGEPEFTEEKLWRKAIPQYNLGYIKNENYFAEFEKTYPGIFLGGNYRGGISVGDCVKNSGILEEKISTYIENK